MLRGRVLAAGGGGDGWGFFVGGGVGDFCEEEGFAAFDAGAAGAAVAFASFITGPGLGEIDVQFRAAADDGGFVEIDEGAEELDFRVGAFFDRGGHGLHEVFAAIGVDRVVSAVGADDNAVDFEAFGESGGGGEHDAVAEGDDGLAHVFLGVVAFGNFAAGGEEIGGEEVADEAELEDFVGEVELLGVVDGEGDFAVVVFGAVIAGDDGRHLVTLDGVVERDGRIHSSAAQDRDLHLTFF